MMVIGRYSVILFFKQLVVFVVVVVVVVDVVVVVVVPQLNTVVCVIVHSVTNASRTV